jgi:hypothetical protein
MWSVEPTQPLAEVSVNRGDFVVKTRLLPPGLIELAEDVVEPGRQKVLAHAGDQLFQAMAGKPLRETPGIDLGVYCSFHPEDVGPAGLMGILAGGRKQIYRCFVDSDRNGRLDGVAPNACISGTVFTIKGRVPAKRDPVSGGAYRKLAPEAIKDGPLLGIVFKGVRRDGAPDLDLAFGNGEIVPSFLSPSGKTGTQNQRRIFGAKVSTIGGTDAAASLRVDEGIPMQPFVMISTGC